jgi:hypothetical protein
MESKYYTPKIEEFHVGFEYESLELGSQTKFNKDVVTDNHLYGDYDQSTLLSELYFHPKKARVKYLDKEDIESLEFKQEGKIYKDKWGNSLELTGYPNYDCRIILVYSSRKFEGKIKNKSEFKRILKQLGL